MANDPTVSPAPAAGDAHKPPATETNGFAVPIRRGEQVAAPISRRGLYAAIGLCMLVAGIVAAALGGMQNNGIYAKQVDALLHEKSRFVGKPVRAEGMLVHGTLVKRESPCEYRFTIQMNDQVLPVRFAQCVVPDTFRDVANTDVQVTVEGKLLADNSFEATNVLAKCPSKYEMKQRQGNGEKMPHGLSESM
jgi:cytochrome c-type biogenesis protein CcmE